MNKDEIRAYFGTNINVRPDRLWYQHGTGALGRMPGHVKTAAARLLAAGTRPETYKCTPHNRTLEEMDALLQSIRKGYSDASGDRVQVAIDRNGHVIVTNGAHRTACAIALGLDAIPAHIVYRDAGWLNLKKALLDLNKSPRLYQWIDHPDFQLWGGRRRDTQLRADIIDRWLAQHAHAAMRGVDVGCNAGVLSCALARAGREMIGLDTNPHAVAAGNALAGMADVGAVFDGASRAHFAKCAPIPIVAGAHREGADFIVCLSLLNHHQADHRSEEGQRIFASFVDAAPIVFLDCPAPGDTVGGDTAFVEPEAVFEWCRASGADGAGTVVAERDKGGLMRTMLVWRTQ